MRPRCRRLDLSLTQHAERSLQRVQGRHLADQLAVDFSFVSFEAIQFGAGLLRCLFRPLCFPEFGLEDMDRRFPGLRELDSETPTQLANPRSGLLEGLLGLVRFSHTCVQFIPRLLKPGEGRYKVRPGLAEDLGTNGDTG